MSPVKNLPFPATLSTPPFPFLFLPSPFWVHEWAREIYLLVLVPPLLPTPGAVGMAALEAAPSPWPCSQAIRDHWSGVPAWTHLLLLVPLSPVLHSTAGLVGKGEEEGRWLWPWRAKEREAEHGVYGIGRDFYLFPALKVPGCCFCDLKRITVIQKEVQLCNCISSAFALIYIHFFRNNIGISTYVSRWGDFTVLKIPVSTWHSYINTVCKQALSQSSPGAVLTCWGLRIKEESLKPMFLLHLFCKWTWFIQNTELVSRNTLCLRNKKETYNLIHLK